MERVSVRRGKNPVLFVAPHGPDDNNTAIIAEAAAEYCDGYYVINRGFEREDFVDVDNDKADCNRIDHVTQSVIKEEFLDPITKFTNQIKLKLHSKVGSWFLGDLKTVPKPLIFYVHGAGDHVHKLAGESVEVIVGYGLSTKKQSLTCEDWRRNIFVYSYRSLTMSGDVYEGQGGGNYAGRSNNNMNQYFRKQHPDKFIDSMQLEFPYSTRYNESIAKITGVLLATVATDVINHDPSNPFVKVDQKFI